MKEIAIWFPTVKTNTGTDIFTENLVAELNKQGIKAEITWLPLRAEYIPWSVKVPEPPEWATIVHVNTWLQKRFLPKNLPIIATLHHSIHDPKLKAYKGLIRTLYHQYWIAPNERKIMKYATQVTAVSQFVANMTKQTLCNMPIQVIYNGVDTSIFRPIDILQNRHRPFRLLYVGGWKKLKGIDLLIPIMQELGCNYELYYTGGHAAEKDKKNMPANMFDLGRLTQQQVIQEMQMADAFLFPSRSEGFGLVATEAMACGTPVIASNIPALSEIITPNKTGYLCAPDDVQDFIKKISYLKHNPLEKVATYFDSQGKFSLDKTIENYVQLYKIILTNR